MSSPTEPGPAADGLVARARRSWRRRQLDDAEEGYAGLTAACGDDNPVTLRYRACVVARIVLG
jgi:hypothetical protein